MAKALALTAETLADGESSGGTTTTGGDLGVVQDGTVTAGGPNIIKIAPQDQPAGQAIPNGIIPPSPLYTPNGAPQTAAANAVAVGGPMVIAKAPTAAPWWQRPLVIVALVVGVLLIGTLGDDA